MGIYKAKIKYFSAIKYTGDNIEDIIAFVGDNYNGEGCENYPHRIYTINGCLEVLHKGWYVCKDLPNENKGFALLSPSAFESRFELQEV